MASPFDPVFYGHHGTVDLLQFIHNRCSYGNKDSRRFDVFSRCTVSTDSGLIPITPDDKITMTSRLLVRKYFDGLDYTYAQFANFEDYTSEYRKTFRMSNDSHLQCYLLMQKVKDGATAIELSDQCRQEYGYLTGTKLTDGDFGTAVLISASSNAEEKSSSLGWEVFSGLFLLLLWAFGWWKLWKSYKRISKMENCRPTMTTWY